MWQNRYSHLLKCKLFNVTVGDVFSAHNFGNANHLLHSVNLFSIELQLCYSITKESVNFLYSDSAATSLRLSDKHLLLSHIGLTYQLKSQFLP